MTPLGYTTRANVENFVGQTFPGITDAEFNFYLVATEKYIHNYCNVNAQTTLSGFLSENIVREKSLGKLDSHGNLVIDLMKPPVHFDSNFNPIVSYLSFNLGAVEVSLQLTDGSNNPKNTMLEVSETRRKVYYPSIYYLPAISTVTPSAKVNLFGLQDLKFWTDISYTGGYDTCPEDISMAATYICSEFIQFRKNPQFLQSFTQGSMSQSFGKRTNAKGFDISPGIAMAQTFLDPYVRYTF